MKHILLTAVLCLGSLSATAAIAQAPAQDAAPAQQRHMHRDPHRQAMHMSRKLGLSPDQTSRVEPILAKRRDGVMAIRQNASLTPDQRKAQMHDLKRNMRQQLAGVLTPDQMQQLKSMHRQHHGHSQQNQDDAAPTGV